MWEQEGVGEVLVVVVDLKEYVECYLEGRIGFICIFGLVILIEKNLESN